jgi:hypothetical protein
MDKQALRDLYKMYRFSEVEVPSENVLAFEHKGGYFQNVDIVPFGELSDAQNIKIQLDSSGYSTIIRNFEDIFAAKKNLFEGFFNLEASKDRVSRYYIEHAKRVTDLIGSPYQYIPSKFDHYGLQVDISKNIVEIISQEIQESGPSLIIIEAAAGYGKTCTSFEIINSINKAFANKLPLLAELSRNRQAQIFKYVLLSELSEQFPGVGLPLAQHHIQAGDIPLLIDGFDELIRGKGEGEKSFEDTEPMLETIRELLGGNAKVILTSRKTAMFSSEEFDEWVKRVDGSFRVLRLSIHAPTVEDWLGGVRTKQMESAGIRPSDIANPVLLSFLRSVDDAQFLQLCADSNEIVDKYFETLLTREQERQELYLSTATQLKILKAISKEMTEKHITSESRDYFEKFISDAFGDVLAEHLTDYPATSRPTVEQMVKKLVMHAFLDRKGVGEEKIGFVNDFIFGTLVGLNIIEQVGGDWLADEQYTEMAVTAYRSRSKVSKKSLWEKLDLAIQFLTPEKMLDADIWLAGKIMRGYKDIIVSEYAFSSLTVGAEHEFLNVVFSDCIFENCDLDFGNLGGSLFLNCKFYSCIANNLKDEAYNGIISCQFFNSPSLEKETSQPKAQVAITAAIDPYQKAILERFWSPGRPRPSIQRKTRTLFMGSPPGSRTNLEEALEVLRKAQIVKVDGDHATLNLSELPAIHNILGR